MWQIAKREARTLRGGYPLSPRRIHLDVDSMCGVQGADEAEGMMVGQEAWELQVTTVATLPMTALQDAVRDNVIIERAPDTPHRCQIA